MAIGVIELRPKACYDDKQWKPAVVGNIIRAGYLRYAADYDEKSKTATIKTLNFLKDGHVSVSDRTRDQLSYSSYAPLMHRHARAIGTIGGGGYNSSRIDRDDTRLVQFKTIKELNVYLASFNIKPVAADTAPANQVVLPQGAQTVQELYEELAKVMATNPASATAPVVKCSGAVDTDILDDLQLAKQTLAISKALLANAIDGVAKRFEAQANAEIARVYKELSPTSKVPTVALTAAVVPPAPKVPAKK